MQPRTSRATPSFRVVALVAFLIAALAAASVALIPSASQVEAQGTDFDLYTDLLSLNDAGSNGTFEVGVRSLDSTVAAVDGSVAYDASALTATGCTSLVDLGACNTSTDGIVRFAAVVADGFTDLPKVPLIEITFRADGPNGRFDVTPSLTAAYDAQLNVVAGNAQSGAVTVGAVLGDANCDGRVQIFDAYVVAQASVEARTPSECPLTGSTQYSFTNSDVNESGRIEILDAFLVARCSVGLIDRCG